MNPNLFKLLLSLLFVKVFAAEKRNITIGSITYEIERAEVKEKSYSQCYVDVAVYNSTSFKFGLFNATVTVLVGELDSPTLRFSDGQTDATGHACIPVACRDEARVLVERNAVRLSALDETTQRKNLPKLFYINLETNEMVKFYVNAWGTIQGKSGPVYSSNEKEKCQNASDTDFHLTYSYISIPDVLMSTQAPLTDINDPNFNKQWYYGLAPSFAPKYCYFKIKVKTKSHQAVIKAYSKLNDSNGLVYGLFQTGPQYDVNTYDTVDQAACVEFRCPAEDIFGLNPPMYTYIEGTLEVPDHKEGCCVKSQGEGQFQVTPKRFRTNTALTTRQRYGSKYGIYMSDNKNIARQKCFTGIEVFVTEYAMNANVGFAFEYDCLLNFDCTVPGEVFGK